MPLPEIIAPEGAASQRWLSIVGIGEDGVAGLSPSARSLIGAAEIVFGGKRHLLWPRRLFVARAALAEPVRRRGR